MTDPTPPWLGPPSPRLAQLIKLLDLEPIEDNVFRGFHPPDREHRLYGGQIMAQALMAATRTVPADRFVHSLHAYFLRPGTPKTAALIDVERIRDGASFTTRRVVVIQNGQAIFNMDASFKLAEDGLAHQAPMPGRRPPPPGKVLPAMLDAPFIAWRENHRQLLLDEPHEPAQDLWIHATGTVPADRALHACLLVYESDNALLGTARAPHKGSFRREHMQVASLDHAMWFHQPVDVNQWLLYSLDSPSAHSARGFTRGAFYTAGGVRVATTAQEGLIRHRPPASGTG